jgi:Icc-related predicted phosphoesterase
MIIDCVSDLHGHFPKLEGGDLLIVAGDLTDTDQLYDYILFYSWLHKQKYKHYIFISGNHDNCVQKKEVLLNNLADTTYLCDSGTEFEGLKIWGSPWTKRFEGENPRCLAFTCDTDAELAKHWALIPPDTDILITHSPPHGILDRVKSGEIVGSPSLERTTRDYPLKLHVFGHIHESYGILRENGVDYVNASIVDEHYRPVNKPIRIVL